MEQGGVAPGKRPGSIPRPYQQPNRSWSLGVYIYKMGRNIPPILGGPGRTKRGIHKAQTAAHCRSCLHYPHEINQGAVSSGLPPMKDRKKTQAFLSKLYRNKFKVSDSRFTRLNIKSKQ